METTNQKIQNTVEILQQQLQNLPPETKEEILQQVRDKMNYLMQGEMDATRAADENITEILQEIEDTEEEKQEAEDKIEKLTEKKEELEAKQELADIMADIMDRMDDCRDAADYAQSRCYDIEEDEDGIGDMVDELIDKIQEIYDTAQGTAEDHSDEIQELEDQIQDLEEEASDAETKIDILKYKAKEAEDRKNNHKTMGRLYEKILARVLYKDWTALLNWMETAEAEVVSTNQENPEEINSVLHELYEAIYEWRAKTPDETPAEAEARMAEEDKEQQEATEKTNTYEEDEADIYHEKFVELTYWVLDEWNGSRKHDNKLQQMRTEVLLWKQAADHREAAIQRASQMLSHPDYEAEERQAAETFLNEINKDK